MSDLDTLRPEVRSALGAMVRADVCRDSVPTEAFDLIRAELLRLTDENARLNKIESLATEQRLQMEDVELYLMDVSQPDDEDAPWCDRMKFAIELLVQDCNYAVGQKNKAEAEVAELRAVCAATYQAAGCYGLPVRFLDALSNAMHGEKLHKVDLDKLLPVAPVDWVERAERAEAELAALKARITGAPIIHAEKTWRGTLFMNLSQHNVDLLDGKRVRLVVEE